MTPLSAEERAMVLRLNPLATAADLEAFELLLAERLRAEVAAPSAAEVLHQRLVEMHDRLFPRFEDAIEQARVEHPPPEDDETPPDDGGIVVA